MATIDLISKAPNTVAVMMRGNTGVYESPLSGNFQTIDRGGLHWVLQYAWSELKEDDAAEMRGIVALLRAQANRIRVPVYDNPKRGLYGGTPLVDTAGQTGSSLLVKGCSNNITNWIRRGDYFSVDVNGEHELKMCTQDASSSPTGNTILNFEPRLRASPLDNAAIWVEDGVLSKPQGVFMLAEPETMWSARPSQVNRTAIQLQFTEDVFISQA